jgi:regulatory protein
VGPGDDGDAASAAPADPVEVARLICLRQLEFAPRTRAQLATVLAKRNVPAEAAETVLDRFTEVGLVDDAAYAVAWVESRHRGRGLARRALSQELRKRGVDGVDASAALDTLEPEQELATAHQLVARRLASTARLEPAARVRRLAGMLARKGYPPALALRVVREQLGDEAEALAMLAAVDEIPEP